MQSHFDEADRKPKLEKNEHWLPAVLENVSDGAIAADPQGHVMLMNPVAEALTGWKLEGAWDRELTEVFHLANSEGASARTDSPVTKALRKGKVVRLASHSILIGKDGTRTPVGGKVVPIRHDHGEATGVVLFFHDISECEWRERELEAIATVGAALRTVMTDADILSTLLDQVRNLLQADGVALAICDPAGGEMVFELGCGSWANLTGSHLPAGESVSAHVIATRQPYVSNSVETDQRVTWPKVLGGLRAVACLPLVVQGQAIGTLWVGRVAGDMADELELLTIASDTVARGVYGLRLQERIAHLCSQLQDRESFITRLLESIPSSLVVMDRTPQIVSVNRNFLDKTRRGERDTLGHKLEEVFPRVLLERTRLAQKVQEAFCSGQPAEGGKVTYRAPRLPTRTYYYRLVPLKEANAVKNVMLLMDDITEQERLGEEVRRIERHLASVVECAYDLVISMDPQGHIVTWNQAAERTSGLKGEQIKAQSLPSMCATEQRPMVQGILRRLARGESVQNTEVNLLTASGGEVPIAWSCSPMPDDRGRVVGIVAVGRNLTEQHLLEAQVLQSAKMASLGVMAGGIAHELRNPLGIISSSAQLLLECRDDLELREECAKKIYASTRRASVIIENLLRFARPQGERMTKVDLHVVLEETFSWLAHEMSLRKVSLSKDFQPKLPMSYGNAGLLQQVFTNLLLNACNAMPQGGRLVVSTSSADTGQVEIRFTDTGCGIPPEHLPRVFDPFFTTMRAGKGVGLGLSICYSIIQHHGGSIGIESQVDHGTTCTVRLPVDGRMAGDR